MATFNKFDSFVEAIAEKVHNLGSDQLAIALTAAANAPVASNTQLSNLTQISYTSPVLFVHKNSGWPTGLTFESKWDRRPPPGPPVVRFMFYPLARTWAAALYGSPVASYALAGNRMKSPCLVDAGVKVTRCACAMLCSRRKWP
jgi:hypothetical protein